MDTITIDFGDLLGMLKSMSKKNPRYITLSLLEPDSSDPDDVGGLCLSAHVVTGEPYSFEDMLDAVSPDEFDSSKFMAGTHATNI